MGDTTKLLTTGSKGLGFEETAPTADPRQSLNSESNGGVHVTQSLHSCRAQAGKPSSVTYAVETSPSNAKSRFG